MHSWTPFFIKGRGDGVSFENFRKNKRGGRIFPIKKEGLVKWGLFYKRGGGGITYFPYFYTS